MKADEKMTEEKSFTGATTISAAQVGVVVSIHHAANKARCF
jgi:hypothetical protein